MTRPRTFLNSTDLVTLLFLILVSKIYKNEKQNTEAIATPREVGFIGNIKKEKRQGTETQIRFYYS